MIGNKMQCYKIVSFEFRFKIGLFLTVTGHCLVNEICLWYVQCTFQKIK